MRIYTKPVATAVLLLALAAPVVAQSIDTRLIQAARSGDVGAVRSALGSGVDVNAAEGDGLTALHAAAERGHAEVVELLLARNADVHAKTRIGSYTPLHLAAMSAHAEIADDLLEAGADANAVTTNSGVTPLHLAAEAIGGAGTVELLLEHGADPNAREASAGQTPLMFAAAENRADAIRVLLEAGADPSVTTRVVDVLYNYALDRAAVRMLNRAIDSIQIAERGGRDWQPDADDVQAAIAAQRAFLASRPDVGPHDPLSLARVGPDYPNGPDVVRPPNTETLVGKSGGMTALLHAARDGHMDAALALLEGGADIDQVSAGDQTSPLLIATLNGQFDLALELIERGADPNLAAATDGVTPLFATLQTQWAPRSNYPQPRAQDLQRSDYMDVMTALVEAGADPNVPLKTHLWYWEYGLNKIGLDLTGATAFFRAALAQDVEAMRLLAQHGADPDIPSMWPAIGMRDRRQTDGRQQEDSGVTLMPEGTPSAWPIHMAAGGGYLGLGAFSMRTTPNQHVAAVKYLVEELGADPNERDGWGYAPLHYAASRGDNALIEYLVSVGADVKAITRLGQSVVDMTRGGRSGFFTRVAYPETERLLLSLGSEYSCEHTHFLDTGDWCEASGVPPFIQTAGDDYGRRDEGRQSSLPADPPALPPGPGN
jgi:ankyrin repeat protein